MTVPDLLSAANPVLSAAKPVTVAKPVQDPVLPTDQVGKPIDLVAARSRL